MDPVGTDLKGSRDTILHQEGDGALGADPAQPAHALARGAADRGEVEHEADAAADRQRSIQRRREGEGVEPWRADQQEPAAGRSDGLVRTAQAG
jgi:hypothetical protein